MTALEGKEPQAGSSQVLPRESVLGAGEGSIGLEIVDLKKAF